MAVVVPSYKGFRFPVEIISPKFRDLVTCIPELTCADRFQGGKTVDRIFGVSAG
jgi:hypothetical protein